MPILGKNFWPFQLPWIGMPLLLKNVNLFSCFIIQKHSGLLWRKLICEIVWIVLEFVCIDCFKATPAAICWTTFTQLVRIHTSPHPHPHFIPFQTAYIQKMIFYLLDQLHLWIGIHCKKAMFIFYIVFAFLFHNSIS